MDAYPCPLVLITGGDWEMEPDFCADWDFDCACSDCVLMRTWCCSLESCICAVGGGALFCSGPGRSLCYCMSSGRGDMLWATQKAGWQGSGQPSPSGHRGSILLPRRPGSVLHSCHHCPLRVPYLPHWPRLSPRRNGCCSQTSCLR